MFILFDIGGTKMRVVAARDRTQFSSEPKIFDTPRDFNDGMALLKSAIHELSGGIDIEIIGGGIAGPFSEKKGSLLGSPNLENWIDKPFKENLENEFNVPVYIENDSAVVGLGEMHHGAGIKEGLGVYITVSTGVGGARFVDGYIDRKSIGFEPGRQIIDADKTLCPDCDGIFLGNYISGEATEKRLGKKAYEIKDEQFWDNYAKLLAYGLNNSIVHWSPDVIVLGGSMIVGDPSISVDKVKEHLKDILKIFPELPEIREAKLGDFGGLYGAMVLVDQYSRNSNNK